MKIKICYAFLLISIFAYTQQEAHYTQYMYNMNVINPGYMINEPGLIEVGTLYRSQWSGIAGAPKTANVFANIPINDRIEISANFLNDQIGDPISVTTNTLNTDIAYKLKLNETLNLSLGLKLGFETFNLNFSGANNPDPTYQNKKNTSTKVGSGLFLFHKKYYVGLSSPNFIPNKIETEASGNIYESKPHFFLIGGYIFDIDRDFKLKPSFVAKETLGAPLTFDLSLNMLYNDRFELGASYRFQDSFAAMLVINLTENLRIGYAYDLNTSDLADYNTGSHEFILLYRFDVILGRKYSSPRFY